MKKKILFTCLLFNLLVSYSQKNIVKYAPSNKDSLFNYITTISEKKIIQLGGKNKKDIKTIINDRKTAFINSINDSSYIFDTEISNYVNNIVSEITKHNSNIDAKDFYFLINKSPIPNAACYGNGIFTINLGLFNLVENDDELAFIISHEIAHFQLHHNDKSLLNYIEKYKSKETKSKINKINNLEYGKMKAYSEFTKEMNYNFLKRNRKTETQADSLGLVIFNSTRYNKNASITSLKQLEFVDEMIFNEDTKIKNHFNFDNYPFKEIWIAKEEKLFDTKESADDYAMNKDSLKTHPDIPERIELLQMYLNNSSYQQSSNKIELERIKKIASEKSISVFLNNLNLDLALYQIMVLYNKKQIDDKSYCNIVGLILMKTYESKKNHTFGKYVSPVNSFSDEKYLNEVRQFLHNLEMKNVRKIGFNFCEKYKNIMQNDPEFSKVENFFKNLNLN